MSVMDRAEEEEEDLMVSMHLRDAAHPAVWFMSELLEQQSPATAAPIRDACPSR